MHTLTVTTTTGSTIDIALKVLDFSYLTQILELQDMVYQHLHDKSWFALTGETELKEYFSNNDKMLGYTTPDNKLIALAIYLNPKSANYNLGYDLHFTPEALLQSGQIECTIVHPDFRGNKLQHKLCHEIELLAKASHIPTLLATVSPDNIYSLNTFLNLGYEVKKEKIKYGGLRRYIIQKNL